MMKFDKSPYKEMKAPRQFSFEISDDEEIEISETYESWGATYRDYRKWSKDFSGNTVLDSSVLQIPNNNGVYLHSGISIDFHEKFMVVTTHDSHASSHNEVVIPIELIKGMMNPRILQKV